jgi:iron(III) transport system ATP-binding protein
LRGIAGFEPVRAGEILIDGEVVTRPGYRLAPEHRRIGMVFQDYALFPHLTVRENVRFGLRSLPRRQSDDRVAELAALVGIGEALDKYPHELSGGQQQRAALARALAPRPELLLLDEPFSNLDVDLRERLSLELREILKASGATAVLVTHDQHEAFAIADEIGVLHDGRIQQWDSAYNLYHRPANRFVADFVGQGVFLPAKVLNPRQVEIELGVLEGNIPHECAVGCEVCGKGCSAEILLRPTTSFTTTLQQCRPKSCTRRFAARRFSTRSAWRAGARCWRSCRATTTMRSARKSASGWMSITSSRSRRWGAVLRTTGRCRTRSGSG